MFFVNLFYALKCLSTFGAILSEGGHVLGLQRLCFLLYIDLPIVLVGKIDYSMQRNIWHPLWQAPTIKLVLFADSISVSSCNHPLVQLRKQKLHQVSQQERTMPRPNFVTTKSEYKYLEIQKEKTNREYKFGR